MHAYKNNDVQCSMSSNYDVALIMHVIYTDSFLSVEVSIACSHGLLLLLICPQGAAGASIANTTYIWLCTHHL